MTLSSSLRGPAILALSLWSLSAHAHLVTFELEGKLECFASCDIFGQQTGLDTSPPNQLYGFTSLVTVDDQSVPSFSNSSRSQYMFDGDGLFTVTMGVLTLSWDRFSMTIAQYQPSGEDGLFVVDSGDTIVGIGWRETYLIAPTIAGIAEAPLELFHKAITEMIVRPPGRGTFELQGHSSSITLVPEPDPTSLLTASGLLSALVLFRRRQARSSKSGGCALRAPEDCDARMP